MWKKGIFICLMLVLSGCASIHLDESMLIRPTHTQPIEESIPEGYTFEEFEVKRRDDSLSYGVSVTNPENSVTILYFGGNQFDIPSQGGGLIERLTESNVNLVMFDRRGYGKSPGNPTVSLLMDDAVEVYDHVRSSVQGTLIVHGLSLGSFEASHVASQRTLDGLVLEGSATNVEQWSSLLIPWYAKPFVKVTIADELKQVDNLAVVKNQTAPLLVIVGDNDNQTPSRLSKRLFDNSKSDVKTLHIFEGGRHGNITAHPEFNAVYRQFVEQVVAL
ncbi:alpha/beta hydrolase [Aliidiomarina minuta]|nr:alpha/beta hydrolase [Aliidiomarina minuta]